MARALVLRSLELWRMTTTGSHSDSHSDLVGPSRTMDTPYLLKIFVCCFLLLYRVRSSRPSGYLKRQPRNRSSRSSTSAFVTDSTSIELSNKQPRHRSSRSSRSAFVTDSTFLCVRACVGRDMSPYEVATIIRIHTLDKSVFFSMLRKAGTTILYELALSPCSKATV